VTLRTAIDIEVETLRNLDPITRIGVSLVLYEDLLEAQAAVAAARRAAVRELRAEGFTLREIAEATGLTHQRVAQLQTGYGRQEKRARGSR
jgi:DNA-directed RNA polymerase specialized sigma24 family protein